jgi:ABC-type transport system involved in multi-copper enzyme maturation permease subunit
MTTPVTTPYRPAQEAGRDGFAQLLRAEWTKFRTVRGWVIGMVVAALVMAAIGLLAAAGSSSCQSTSSSGPARSGGACGPMFTAGPGGVPVSDSFYFVRQPLSGDGSMTVQVSSLTGRIPPANGNVPADPGASPDTRPGLVPWAKAGVIIKESTRSGSAYAAIMVTASHGVRLQGNYTADTAGQPGTVSPSSPRWLRLARSGDTITGYDSADGTHWTRVGTVRLAGLAGTVRAGLFAASPAYASVSQSFGGGSSGSILPSQATAVFGHLSRSGTWPARAWSGDYVGSGQGSGIGGFHQASGRFTVTGSGDIAPIVAGSGNSGDPGKTVTNFLVGTFAGLIAVIVVATLFITAEYRRDLIRLTLTASPRRGRVLAAKAIVVGAVTFAAGLVAALVAVIVGTWLGRAQGSYVFPLSWLTQTRVIAGTAALMAVAAVLALAVGTLLRRSAAAVTAVIVVIVLPYILGAASILPAGASEWLLRVTPAAAFAIQQGSPAYPQVTAEYTPTSGYFPLAPWAGLAVLCGYAALALGLATVMLRRRDA